jgi:hypothetical protein
MRWRKKCAKERNTLKKEMRWRTERAGETRIKWLVEGMACRFRFSSSRLPRLRVRLPPFPFSRVIFSLFRSEYEI